MGSIKFYINKSDARKITKDIEQIGNTLSCEFIADVDMIYTAVRISNSENRIDINANYCYIDTTKRYYYINDVTYTQGMIIVKLKCDVLMSFQKAILAQPVIVKRQSNLYNLYQEDEKFKVYNYTVQRHKDFSGGFSASTQNFLLTVVGKTTNPIE